MKPVAVIWVPPISRLLVGWTLFRRIVVALLLHGTLTARETPRLAEFTVILPRYG